MTFDWTPPIREESAARGLPENAAPGPASAAEKRIAGRLGRALRKLVTVPPYQWPWRLLARFTSPIPPGLWLVKLFVQRILRINGSAPWMVHFRFYVTRDVFRMAQRIFPINGRIYL